jgi:hypothetical protein
VGGDGGGGAGQCGYVNYSKLIFFLSKNVGVYVT